MAADYTNKSVQKALDLIETLSGRELEFTSLAAIAEASGLEKDNALRLLWNLEQRGYVETNGRGSYRLSPRIVRFAEKFRLGLVERARALDSTFQSYIGDIDDRQEPGPHRG
ncbi:MAG: helix-turn-helix domain-containing protein [Candidatus Alcyoniella australis]|nr:helix-turn-helix domain-containing protein [Candidatus Alcyoniella australis]